jgi:osmotically inducible protein OsmC
MSPDQLDSKYFINTPLGENKMNVLYTAEATTRAGRKGHSETADGRIKLDMALPKSMGGDGSPGANPEQLFAMGYSACFGGAIDYVANQQKKSIKDISVTAKVSIGTDEKGGLKLAVELEPHLPGVPLPEAEALVAAAHQVCPYSKATRGNVEVKIKVV